MRLSGSERKKVVTSYLAGLWGPKALSPLHFVDYNWMKDPYVGGAYSIVLPPGAYTQYNSSALYDDFRRIAWTGADYRPLDSDEDLGYINGAIAGGREVAAALTEKLQRETA